MLCLVLGLAFVALIAALLIFGLLTIGAAFSSSVYALIRRRWSAIPRAFVVQMSALAGAIFGATVLLIIDLYWNIGWGWQAELIVGGLIGLILGILFGLAVNAIGSRIWRWARPRCDPVLDPADEAKHKI